MPTYIELSINPKDCNALDDILNLLYSYKYRIVGVPENLVKSCKPMRSQGSITVISYKVIKGDNLSSIKRSIADKETLNIATTSNLSVFRHLAHIRGLDAIRVNPQMSKYLDKSQARLLRTTKKIIVLSLREYLSTKNNMYKLFIAVRRMYAYDIPFALVTNATGRHEVMHPRMIKGVLTLIGVPYPYNMLPISTYPLRVVGKLVNKIKE